MTACTDFPFECTMEPSSKRLEAPPKDPTPFATTMDLRRYMGYLISWRITFRICLWICSSNLSYRLLHLKSWWHVIRGSMQPLAYVELQLEQLHFWKMPFWYWWSLSLLCVNLLLWCGKCGEMMWPRRSKMSARLDLLEIMVALWWWYRFYQASLTFIAP